MQNLRRYVPLLIAGAVLIATACRDSIAPKRSTKADDAALVLLSKLGGPKSFTSPVDPAAEASARVVSFTIEPTAGQTRIGDFFLKYDANSVCDPEKSSYGPDEWLKPCETLDAPITVTGRFWFQGTEAFSDFSPNIRFAPDKNVYLWVNRPQASDSTLSAFLMFEMWYTTVVGDTRLYVDDAFLDPSVRTHVNASGIVYRRIRHFSGYYVRSGAPCDDTAGDPECVPGGNGDGWTP